MDTPPNPLPTRPEPAEPVIVTVPVESPTEPPSEPVVPLPEPDVAVAAPVVTPAATQPSILDEEAQSKLDDSRYDYKAVEVNLFVGHSDLAPVAPAPAMVAAVASAAAVPVVGDAKAAPRPRRLVWWYVGLAAVVLLAGGAATYWFGFRTTAGVAVVATPRPATPTPLPSPSASPSPSSTPVSTPTPIVPQPQTVTAPTVAPTAAKPQPVTVTSPNGLWLRSSPDSSSSKNIIGWIPNGGVVSVDQTGSFWWHGSYSGKTGYFAANYTK